MRNRLLIVLCLGVVALWVPAVASAAIIDGGVAAINSGDWVTLVQGANFSSGDGGMFAVSDYGNSVTLANGGIGGIATPSTPSFVYGTFCASTTDYFYPGYAYQIGIPGESASINYNSIVQKVFNAFWYGGINSNGTIVLSAAQLAAGGSVDGYSTSQIAGAMQRDMECSAGKSYKCSDRCHCRDSRLESFLSLLPTRQRSRFRR